MREKYVVRGEPWYGALSCCLPHRGEHQLKGTNSFIMSVSILLFGELISVYVYVAVGLRVCEVPPVLESNNLLADLAKCQEDSQTPLAGARQPFN